jgi:VPDSG-CTERM motif
MKISKFLIVTLLCVGLASAADAKHKSHHHKHHKKSHHHASNKPTPVPPVPMPPVPVVPPTPGSEHHTITPSVVSINSPGVWTYAAMLSSGQVLNGDGFTIFDFGGYVANSIFAPAGWTATAQLTGSVLGVAPPASNPDNPALFNLLFTRSGGTEGPAIIGLLSLGHFGATTTSKDTTFVGWSSRDHFPTGHPPSPGTDHADIILAPAAGAVPDGGATVALLGIALGGLEGMRRLIRARNV